MEKKKINPKNLLLTSAIISGIGAVELYLSGLVEYPIFQEAYTNACLTVSGWVLLPTPLYFLIIGGIINYSKSKTIKNG